VHQAAKSERLRAVCDELQAEGAFADAKFAAAGARAEGAEAELEDAQVRLCSGGRLTCNDPLRGHLFNQCAFLTIHQRTSVMSEPQLTRISTDSSITCVDSAHERRRVITSST